MENTAKSLPLMDLFGEQVVIQRRVFTRRAKKAAPAMETVQLGFLDILEMSDSELEALRLQDEISDEYVEWLREYILKLTLKQIIHSQVSESNRAEALQWAMSDEVHPFSFRVCCDALGVDYEEIREGLLTVIKRQGRKVELDKTSSPSKAPAKKTRVTSGLTQKAKLQVIPAPVAKAEDPVKAEPEAKVTESSEEPESLDVDFW